MGLRKVMEFRHNWNESVVRQFYTTLEVDMEDEQTLIHGKGLVERSEREASPFDEVEVDFSDDEYEHEEDGVRPICLVNRPKIDYS